MSRAKEDLVLMQPMRFYVRGQHSGADKHVYVPRSRFIEDQDLMAFDIVSPPALQSDGNAPVEPRPRVDLKSAMRRMWRQS